MKQLVIIALIAAGGFAAYKYFPGLRTSVAQKIENLKNWDEDDIKKDPVGYIEWATGQLSDNVEKFQEALEENQASLDENEAAYEKYATLEKTADEALGTLKEHYKRVQAGDGSWPITFAGNELSEELFMKQVTGFQADKVNATKLLGIYEKNVKDIKGKRSNVEEQIAKLKRSIQDLEAQKATVKADALNAETEATLAKLDGIVDRTNDQVAAKGGIMSLEEFSLAKQKEEAAAAEAAKVEASTQNALDFLNS